MPKGPSRQWRKRMEPILDDEVRASVAMAKDFHGPGNHDYEKRFHATLVYGGLKSYDEAYEIKKALCRSATFLGYSLSYKIEKAPLGGWQVRYTAICKECGTAYVQLTYPDPSTRPYNPRRPRNNTDHD